MDQSVGDAIHRVTIELVDIAQNASVLEKCKTLCLKQTGFPRGESTLVHFPGGCFLWPLLERLGVPSHTPALEYSYNCSLINFTPRGVSELCIWTQDSCKIKIVSPIMIVFPRDDLAFYQRETHSQRTKILALMRIIKTMLEPCVFQLF